MTRYTLKAEETTLNRALDTRIKADRQTILAALYTFAGGAFACGRDVDPQTLRAVMLRHRHGGALQMRIDGLQADTNAPQATYLHVASGDHEPALYEGWRMTENLLPDGSRTLVARAIAVAARELLKPGGAWRYGKGGVVGKWAWVVGAERRTPEVWRP